MALFVVSSGYEQKIIHDYFGYDNEEIIITGLARWDVLEDKSDPAHKEILLMLHGETGWRISARISSKKVNTISVIKHFCRMRGLRLFWKRRISR